MSVLDCLMAETVSTEGGEKLLPKLGRPTDAKKKYDRKKYAGESKLASYSVDKTNKDCPKLGHTKLQPQKGFEQGKRLNGPRVEQQQQHSQSGLTTGTGSCVNRFSNRWSNRKTGSRVEKFKQSLRRNVESMRRSSKSKTLRSLESTCGNSGFQGRQIGARRCRLYLQQSRCWFGSR